MRSAVPGGIDAQVAVSIRVVQVIHLTSLASQMMRLLLCCEGILPDGYCSVQDLTCYWMIRPSVIGCWSCWKGIKPGLVPACSASTIMACHPYHQIVLYKHSSLRRPSKPVKVNCTTFHYFLQLSAADQDLHWALGLCFVCGKERHRSECCRWTKACGPLFCSFLPDPYRKCPLFFCSVDLDLISLFLLELDCVRPAHADSSPLWGNAELVYPSPLSSLGDHPPSLVLSP